MTVEFKFSLDTRYIHHIKEKSSYNHNYYKLDLSQYGDYILTEKCDILYQECIDDCYEAYYSLGYFDENNKFQAMWTWSDSFLQFETNNKEKYKQVEKLCQLLMNTDAAEPIIPNTFEVPFEPHLSYIPESCRGCPNHPNNGGSGFCLCTLGQPKIT